MAFGRRRSPYDDQDVPDLLSKYDFSGGDDEQSPLMRQATSRGSGGWQKYAQGGGEVYDALSRGGGGGSAPAEKDPDAYTPLPPQDGGDAGTSDKYGPEDQATHGTLSGSAGDAANKYGGAVESDEMDWGDTAPEAAGTASFSTTPQNAQPRSNVPLTKADVGGGKYEDHTGGGGADDLDARYNATYAKVAALDKQRDKEINPSTGKAIGRGLLHAVGGPFQRDDEMRLAAIERQRGDAMRELNHIDGLRSMRPSGRPVPIEVKPGEWHSIQATRSGQKIDYGITSAPPQVMRERAKKDETDLTDRAHKEGRLDEAGHYRWRNPVTGKMETDFDTVTRTTPEIAGPAAPGTAGYENRDAQQPFKYDDQVPINYAKPGEPKEGRPISVTEGYLDKQGNYHRTKTDPEKPEKPDPREAKALAAGEAAAKAHYAMDMEDHAGATKAFDEAYTRTMTARERTGSGGAAAPKVDPQNPPRGTVRTSRKTGKKEIFTSTGWAPYSGTK